MKNIKIYILAAFALLALGSCNEDFLEKNPPLDAKEGDIFVDADYIESTLLGLYAQIKNTSIDGSFMGGKGYVIFDARGEDFTNISGNLVELAGVYNMATGSTDDENTMFWQNGYMAINDANILLANLEKYKDVVGDKYAQFKSEALFVRAFAYYYLNMLYGKPYKLDKTDPSVPLRLTAALTNDGNNLACSTVEEIFNQVLSDLSDANLAALPVNGATSYDETTRATQAAAHVLRMRVYMAMEKWDKAITEGLAVSGYSLVEDFKTMFTGSALTEENIFTFPMADNNRPNTQESVWEYFYDGTIMIIDRDYGVCKDTAYFNAADARIKSLTSTLSTGEILCTKINSRTDNIPVYRYSEVLLNLAECYANTAGGESTAKDYLKQVRRRSLADASDTIFSNAKIDDLTGEALKTAIYNEKRLEFLGEGIRDLDKHRRCESYIKPDINVTTADLRSYIWPLPTSETSINKLAE